MVQVLPRIGKRHVLLGSVASLVVLGLLAWWLWPREEPPSGTIRFMTGADRGVYQQYGNQLRTAIVEDMPGLKVALQDSNGSQTNVRAVATGEADVAIAAADAVQTYIEEGRPGAEKLRGVARLYDDYVQLVVPADSTIRNVSELKGKRVAVGPEGSGVRLIAERLLAADGLDIDKDIDARPDTIATSPDALRTGKIDAFFWSGGLPTRGLTNLAEKQGYDFGFVPISGDLVTNLHDQGGVFSHYRTSVMPVDAYPTILTDAVPTLTVANLLITREDVNPRLVEWLTRVVLKSRDKIGEDVHAAQVVDLRTAIYTDPLPLHKGAAAYYLSVKP
ncbi:MULTISPECIES: TAXI family TRAP transporter solute-binding subunit [Streptomyces]|uniref:TAXI family TRAP transporter solute-binding subunit n=1 Tax=Streptomyces griseiscabiei TaxID=2993540 RepID=A0ABU4LH68_9ACTN|nr:MULTISPECIES: TAXI family TRAP transporter solute-binding subunit [Streptomyces]MBZ3904208.1 TAXI family TRAP transporter solute-binding subunit [Streptomyces griseiscabiei]MDX2914791.1 TAXI family TRAP transporter solute-binding subunit [Streptomyces griseiscabiei]